jgi:hypothetical protein
MPSSIVFFLGPARQSPRMMNHIHELLIRNHRVSVVSYGSLTAKDFAYGDIVHYRIFPISFGWSHFLISPIHLIAKVVFLAIQIVAVMSKIDFPDFVLAQVICVITLRFLHSFQRFLYWHFIVGFTTVHYF